MSLIVLYFLHSTSVLSHYIDVGLTHIPLAQIMACRLVGAKPLSQAMLGYCKLDPGKQTSLKSNLYILIQENAFENVVSKMGTICLGLAFWSGHQMSLWQNTSICNAVSGISSGWSRFEIATEPVVCACSWNWAVVCACSRNQGGLLRSDNDQSGELHWIYFLHSYFLYHESQLLI